MRVKNYSLAAFSLVMLTYVFFAALAFILLVFTTAVYADVPRTLVYQGKSTDTEDFASTGIYEIGLSNIGIMNGATGFINPNRKSI